MTDSFDWLTLDQGESVLWSSRPHRVTVYSSLVIGIPLSIVLIGFLFVAWTWLWYRNTHYVVTDQRIVTKHGILSRDVKTVDFEKVQNINYRQSALGREFGYGTVKISTAGSDDVEICLESVPDPADVQDLVDREIKRHRGHDDDTAGGKRDVLDEVVRELRAIRGLLEDATGNQSGGQGSNIGGRHGNPRGQHGNRGGSGSRGRNTRHDHQSTDRRR